MKRRDFLGHAGLILGSGALGGCPGPDASDGAGSTGQSAVRASQPLLSTVGVQLYTVRSLMAEDVKATLQAVADLGYREVEFAGLFDQDPGRVRGWLDEMGLRAPAAHLSEAGLGEDLDSSLALASALGMGWLVLPWVGEGFRSVEGYQNLAALLNQAGSRAAASGVRVAYHNHAFEFDDLGGTTGFDLLLAETDPDLVDFEVDLYWLAVGGRTPGAVFEAHPSRFPLCHLKDRTAAGDMVAVGAGELDWPAVVSQADLAGLQHYFVEHDNPEDPMLSISESLRYLTAG